MQFCWLFILKESFFIEMDGNPDCIIRLFSLWFRYLWLIQNPSDKTVMSEHGWYNLKTVSFCDKIDKKSTWTFLKWKLWIKYFFSSCFCHHPWPWMGSPMWNKRIQLNGNHNIEWRWSITITNIIECDTWRVTETECDVTMGNMTPTIILFMSFIITSQALFFGGVRNARQNDMWVVNIL